MALARLTAVALCLISVLSSSGAGAGIALTDAERAFIREHPQIIVGGEMDWPPMDFVEDGVYKGAAKDYLDEIERRTGMSIKVVTGFTWSELLWKIRRKEIDVLPMMYWSKQRGQEFNLTNPFITVRHYLYTMAGQDKLTELADFSGRTVAIPKDYAHVDYLENNHPDINVLQVTTTLAAIDAVVTGKADAVIENTASIAYYSKKHSIMGLEPALPMHFEANNVHMAVRSDWPILRDILQKALDDISPETTTRIMATWTGSEARAKSFLTERVVLSEPEQALLAAKGSLTACINATRMPFEGHSGNRHSGIGADTLAIIADSLGIAATTVPAKNWRQIQRYVQLGRCDIVPLALLGDDGQRLLITTTAYIEEPLALATRTSASYVDDLGKLADVRLGVVEGYADLRALRARYPSISFIALPDLETVLREVESGALFGALDYVPTLSYAITQRHDGALRINGNFTLASRFGFASASSQPQLAALVERALHAIADANHQTIHRKWVAVTTSRHTDYMLVLQVLAVVFVAFLLLFYRYREVSAHRGEIRSKNKELAAINTALAQKSDVAMHMAYHDQLTGLCNRTKLMMDLQHSIALCKRRKSNVAVLFLDLDRFKFVNDSLGHDVGDRLLQEVATTIQSLLRETDILCRLGGDEFIVVLEEFCDEYSPCIVAQRIIAALATPFDIDGQEVEIGTSIGISVYPEDATDATALIKFADSAMYAAKDAGRNGFRYYRKELSELAVRRLRVESALRRALPDNNFSLVFQPIINLNKNCVTSAEALIRWHDPVLGAVFPDQFIPIAEEIGLIADIGEWVLRHACRGLNRFSGEGCALEAVAVNISSIELRKENIADRFGTILSEEKVPAARVEIEITENAMILSDSGELADLDKLRALGVGICVDDFGTGYSSLSYLKKLPLNVIKIDRSFIQHLPDNRADMKIARAIIMLSHSLGFPVVAEGVETADQLAILREWGCEFAQGYYFSKPVPAAQFVERVQQINQRLRQSPDADAPVRIVAR